MINHPNLGRKRRESAQAAVASNVPLTGFSHIKHAVAAQFQRMAAHDLFRTGVDKDAMWSTYLASLPEGTNPVFRERTKHDCSCCRQFVRAVGDVVAIIDGKLTSIWDVAMESPTYEPVAKALAELVKARPIDNRFLHVEAKVGTDKNFEDAINGVKTWEHFFITLPNSRVCAGKDIGPRLSEAKALHDVLLRALAGSVADPAQNVTATPSIAMDAIDAVLELIGQNSLYRGEEHRHAIVAFKEMKTTFDRLSPEAQDAFVWVKSGELPASVSKIRNTSIGTLLTDLSEGMDLEGAVRKFEVMVAPANYKRPTALVTPAMIAKAKATVEELGLTSALERRYATLTDITVNNILFADRSARKVMTGGVFDDLTATASVKPKTFDKVEEVPIDKFLADILPKADTIELFVENHHAGNLVSLIAPADPTAKELFKWDNRFSWSYSGDYADSVKERVKKAGGNVTGDLCCRLAWFNRDDLDFHMIEPGGAHIYFGNKQSRAGGMLDVDMNVRGETREPVENIFYPSTTRMPEGIYQLFVNQFCPRESADSGFEAEIDFKGALHRFSYAKAMRHNQNVVVAKFRYSRSAGLEIIESLPMTIASRKVWNVDTEAFHRVNVVMLSPNHWDGQGIGNRHYFFMLDGCQNDGTARGFYNEFLKTELDPHRKVFELVGSKMRADESVNQLSGLGFSSTQRNHAVIRVKGAVTRTLKVTF